MTGAFSFGLEVFLEHLYWSKKAQLDKDPLSLLSTDEFDVVFHPAFSNS